MSELPENGGSEIVPPPLPELPTWRAELGVYFQHRRPDWVLVVLVGREGWIEVFTRGNSGVLG